VNLIGHLTAVALLAALSGASAAQSAPSGPVPGNLTGPRAAAPTAAAPAPQGMLADVARVVGMNRCRPVLERLSTMVADESQRQDVLVDRNTAIAGEGPVFLLMGMQGRGVSAGLSLSVVPEDDGSCSFAAERISMAPYTCDSVGKAELPQHRVTRLLDNFTVYTDPADPAASVSMIDAPPGCIIIRRHVQFRWKPPAAAAPVTLQGTPQAPSVPAAAPAAQPSRNPPQPPKK
jgi:hypothetical protein